MIPERIAEIKRDLERGQGADQWPSVAVAELVAEVERLRNALADIASYDVEEIYGYVDEWSEAAAYDSVCKIAEEALSRKMRGS